MEKHPNSHLFRMKSILTNVTKKIPLAMKCTLLMLFVCVGLAFAGNGYAQNTLLDLSMENKTVDEVLSEIQKNTGFVFFYNNNVVDTDRKVSVRVKNENVFKVLDQIFKDTAIGYKVS